MKSSDLTDREARRAEALRENLKRRKAKARAQGANATSAQDKPRSGPKSALNEE